LRCVRIDFVRAHDPNPAKPPIDIDILTGHCRLALCPIINRRVSHAARSITTKPRTGPHRTPTQNHAWERVRFRSERIPLCCQEPVSGRWDAWGCAPFDVAEGAVVGSVRVPGSDFAEESVVQVRAGHAGDRVVPGLSCPGLLVITRRGVGRRPRGAARRYR
jgi:hypothetical protein